MAMLSDFLWTNANPEFYLKIINKEIECYKAFYDDRREKKTVIYDTVK